MISTLECLPNELLLLIFNHVPIFDLLNTFYGLNYRFSRLIQFIRHLHMDFSHEPLSKTQFINIINEFRLLHVESIKISNRCHADAISIFTSKVFATRLNHLRSLKLIDVDRYAMAKLVRSYPLLSSLSIETSLWRSMPPHCLPYFSKLTYCRLPSLDFLNGCHSSIIDLTLDNCTSSDLIKLNTVVPNLQHLTVRLNSNMNISSIINFSTRLVSLKLILRSMLFIEFQRFIAIIQHIQDLTVSFSNSEFEIQSFDQYLFGDKWFLISQYVDNLHFNIIVNQSFEAFSIPNLLSAFNWFPRKLICETIDNTNGYHLYSLPFCDQIYTLNTVDYDQNVKDTKDFDRVEHLHVTIPSRSTQNSLNYSLNVKCRNLQKLTLIVPGTADHSLTPLMDKLVLNERFHTLELRFTSATNYCRNLFNKLIYSLPPCVHTLIMNRTSTTFLSDLLDENDQLLSNVRRLECLVKSQDHFDALFLLLITTFPQKHLVYLNISLENPSDSSNLLSGWIRQTDVLKKARIMCSNRQCAVWF